MTTKTNDNTTKPEDHAMEKTNMCKTNGKHVSKELNIKTIGEVHLCTFLLQEA